MDIQIKIDINVCRVCLQPNQGPGINMFSNDILEKFLFTTLVQVKKDDGLSQILCKKCVNRLRIAYDFKKQAEASEKHLRRFILDVNKKFQQVTKLDGSNLKEEIDEEDLSSEHEAEQEHENEHEHEHDIENDQLDENDCNTMLIYEDASYPYNNDVRCNTTTDIAKNDISNQSLVDMLERNVNSTSNDADRISMLEEQILEDNYDETNQDMEVLIINENEVELAAFTIENVEEDDMLDDYSQNDETIDSEMNAEELDIFEEEEHLDDTSLGYDEMINNNKDKLSSKTKDERDESKATSAHYCSKCSKVFSTRTNLTRHMMTHDGQKPFVCQLCGNSFTQNGSLKSHMYIHTGERPYACTKCPKSFTQSKSLTFHMRRHTGEKPFCCDKCGMKFRQKDGLKRHEATKHTSRPNGQYPCEICGKVLLSKYSLKFHLSKHSTEVEGLKCTICHEDFKSKTALSRHKRQHHRHDDNDHKLKCSECGVKFDTTEELIAHTEKKNCHEFTKDFEAKLFSCDHCDKAFDQELDFLKHLSSHAGDSEEFEYTVSDPCST